MPRLHFTFTARHPSHIITHRRPINNQPWCVCVFCSAFRLKMRATHCSMFWEILLSSDEMCVCVDTLVLYITYWFIDVGSVQSDGMKHADVSRAICLSFHIIETHMHTAYIHHTQTYHLQCYLCGSYLFLCCCCDILNRSVLCDVV